ncbi:MAG TPA: hypothetical protein PKD85_00235 [Saprospiraceae bacterium]|nr:hypothetical protein [Saprospiraceae bacterium]
MSFIFGSSKKVSLSDQVGKLTADFRKKRSNTINKLVPQAFENLKVDLVTAAGNQTKSTTVLDLTQFHNRVTPTLNDDEKLELSNQIAKLFDKEGMDVLRNTSEKSPWCSITVTWSVPEEESEAEVEVTEKSN